MIVLSVYHSFANGVTAHSQHFLLFVYVISLTLLEAKNVFFKLRKRLNLQHDLWSTLSLYYNITAKNNHDVAIVTVRILS